MNRPGRPGPHALVAARLVAGLVAGLLSGCGGSRSLEPYRSEPGPYDVLGADEIEGVSDARAFVAAGELENARKLLRGLSDEVPGNLLVATFRQDVELALLSTGSFVPGLVLGEHERDPRERLLRLYAERAGDERSVADLVLMARLARDEDQASDLLDQALALDADCVWAHYGRAWMHFRARRFREAEAAVSAAIALDPGHLRTRRLEAALLARSGELELAIEAHERWLDVAQGDPRADPNRVADVRVDLATIHVLRDEPEEALAALEGIAVQGLPRPAQAELVRATALERLDRLGEALEATRRAAELAPDAVLPLVQRALLLGERLDDPEGEYAAWQDVLQVLEASSPTSAEISADPAAGEIASLLVRVQATSRMARLEAAGIGGP